MADTGILSTLWKQFGFFEATPVNLSDQEKRSSGLGGSVLDTMTWYHQNVNPSTDYASHLDELNEMSRFEFIHPIVELYAEEATQPDTSNGKTVWYECNDAEVEKSLNKMLEQINIEEKVYSIAYDLAAFGNHYERLLRTEEDGICQITPVVPKKIKRVWEPVTRKLVGFQWEDVQPDEKNGIQVGNAKIFRPWEFLHFRRIGRASDNEYGEALIEHLFPLYRKIKMGTDQMLIYRLHTMPSRFAVYIDTGTQTVSEAMETTNLFKNHFRSSLAMGKNILEARHNPMALDSMMFMPMPKDSQTRIDQLKGDSDVPDVPDLKLLFNMLFGAARVPKAYLGFDEDSGGLAKASLVTQDMRFARVIRVLRRPLVVGLHRLAQLHVAFIGKDPDKFKIKVHMSKICALEEEVKATMMEKQAAMASQLIDICQRMAIPNKDVVELVFREILHLPSNFVNVAKLAMSVQQAVGAPGGGDQMGMGGPPGMGGGGGDLGSELGLGSPDQGGSPLTNDPSQAGAGAMQTTAQQSPTNMQFSSFEGGISQKLVEQAFQAFHSGMQTLTEGALLEELKPLAWELKSSLKDLSSIRTSNRVSMVENFNPGFCPDPNPGKGGTSVSGAVSSITEADAHPGVRMARATRETIAG